MLQHHPRLVERYVRSWPIAPGPVPGGRAVNVVDGLPRGSV